MIRQLSVQQQWPFGPRDTDAIRVLDEAKVVSNDITAKQVIAKVIALLLRGPNGHYCCMPSHLIITTERHMSVPCGEAGRPCVHGPAGLETKIVKI